MPLFMNNRNYVIKKELQKKQMKCASASSFAAHTLVRVILYGISFDVHIFRLH